MIPNSVTTIEKAAFHMCLALESVTIPNSVTHISGAAFADCQSLTKVTLGTGVKEIGEQAFGGEYTTKLYDIYCYATNPPKAFESTFTNYNAIVHVPCDNYQAYYSDMVWGNFKQIECIGAENGNVVSDLLMANVEALSQSENNDDKIYCCGNVGTCMIVYDSSFNRKEVVGLKFSTPCP